MEKIGPLSTLFHFAPSTYLEMEEVGRGSQAIVFKAKNKVGKIVAIKCFFTQDAKRSSYQKNSDRQEELEAYLDSCFESDGTSKEALYEFALGQKLSFPNIIKIESFYVDPEGHCCLVMEYCDGVPFNHQFKNDIQLKIEGLELLLYLHDQGLMHNDLYSDNFLVEQGHLKMIDLGSLTKLEEKDQQEDGDVETIKNYLKNIGSFLAIEFPKLSKEPLNRQTIVQIQNILRLKKEELLLQAQVVSEFNKIL